MHGEQLSSTASGAPGAVTLATAAGTAAYAAQFPQFARTLHFRTLRLPEPCRVSSLGLGSYLGPADDATDAGYEAALQTALAGGINLVDTAINYRHQRSERALGRALASSAVPRDQVFLCSKAGFVPFDGDMPADARRYIEDTYLRPRLIPPGQLAAGAHCMAPVFLADQLQRSLDNLGVCALDVFYVHNPETQQAELSREEFYRRLRLAFELLEKQAALGRIRAYGVATWNGLRVPPDAIDYLDLNRMVATARELAGEQHHFRFVQLPYNLAMPEAFTLLNQTVEKPPYVSTLNAAFRLGLHAIASASLMSGRLREIPAEGRQMVQSFLPAAATDAELALQFVRSTGSVTAALVGMSNPAHVTANLRAAAVAPAPPSQVGKMLQQ
ncbi:MAG TPA: aldo/keto reductase [Terriglobales bacterium]